MHLASLRERPDPPSNFDLACRLLRDNIRQDPGCNYLWTKGRWVPASVDDIMRRANEHQKAFGRPQFANKREWIV